MPAMAGSLPPRRKRSRTGRMLATPRLALGAPHAGPCLNLRIAVRAYCPDSYGLPLVAGAEIIPSARRPRASRKDRLATVVSLSTTMDARTSQPMPDEAVSRGFFRDLSIASLAAGLVGFVFAATGP